MASPHVHPTTASTNRAPLLDYFLEIRSFKVLPRDVLADLVAHVVERTYVKGHNLYYAGDPPSHVYVVKSGLVALTEQDENDNAHVMLTFSSGDVFGSSAAVLDLPRACTATALVDTKVFLICQDAFQDLCRRFPELAHGVIRDLYAMLRRSWEGNLHLRRARVVSRVAAFLLESAARVPGATGESLGLDLDLSHQDLALLLGTSRETVTRTLARLSRDELIDVAGRRVLIRKLDALRDLARG